MKYFEVIPKLFAILIYLYYIVCWNSFTVKWNFMKYLFPNSYLVKIDTGLNAIGTFILLIPLVLVIISIVIEKPPIWLRIAGAFFGYMGTIYAIVQGFRAGTLNDYVNFRIFTIEREISLEDKKQMFYQYFNIILEDTQTLSKTKIEFVKHYLDTNYSTKHHEIIKTLPASEIKQYVAQVFEEISKQYENINMNMNKTNFNWPTWTTIAKGFAITLAAAAIVSVIYGIIAGATTTEAVARAADLGMQTVQAGAQVNENVVDLGKIVNEHIIVALRTNMLTYQEEFTKIVGNMIRNAIKENNQYLIEDAEGPMQMLAKSIFETMTEYLEKEFKAK